MSDAVLAIAAGGACLLTVCGLYGIIVYLLPFLFRGAEDILAGLGLMGERIRTKGKLKMNVFDRDDSHDDEDYDERYYYYDRKN